MNVRSSLTATDLIVTLDFSPMSMYQSFPEDSFLVYERSFTFGFRRAVWWHWLLTQ